MSPFEPRTSRSLLALYRECSDKRFVTRLSITLHDFEIEYKLGLVYIKDTCDAHMLKQLESNKLYEFGLNSDSNVVASTYDGAAVMKMYGNLIGNEVKLCYNHGIHLAIMDVY